MSDISILQLDGNYIIPLMQIKTYYSGLGMNVSWYSPLFSKPSMLYVTKLFDFTPNYDYYPSCEVVKGGTGFDIHSKLPKEIEDIRQLDYSIYPDCDCSIQFFSRGCIRNCPFCVVRQKEGYICPQEPYSLNPNGKYIDVLDNNFFANPEWKYAVDTLIKWNQPVNFHGVDARIMTEEHAYWLNKIKRYKQIHIAWDNPKDDLIPKLKEIIKYIKPYKLMCYVLVGYWSTPEEDLYRVEKLRELGIDPFVMPFNKSDKYQKDFARWVNHKAIFRTVKWQDYKTG